MEKISKGIIVVCAIIIILTLRIKRINDTITIQFGIIPLIKEYLNL